MYETLAGANGAWTDAAWIEAVAWRVLDVSWRASALGLVALVVLTIGRRGMAPRWRFAVWALVLVRFVVPWTPAAPWSLFGMWDARPQAAEAALAASQQPLVNQSSLVGESEFQVRTANPVEGFDADRVEPVAVSIDVQASDGGPIDWQRTAVIVWLVVAAGFLLREPLLAIRLRRRQRAWRRADDPQLSSFYARCKAESGVVRDVPLLLAADDAGPASVGAWRTCVVIPASLVDELPATELRLVLLHELMHCRRRDVLTDRLAALVAGLHWFNPFVWFALGRLRAEREMACDAAVLDLVGERQRGGYGQTVLNVMARYVRPAPWPGLVGFGQRASVTRRIMDIAGYRRASRASTLLAVTVAVLLALTGFTKAMEAQAPVPAPLPRSAQSATAAIRSNKITLAGRCVEGDAPISDARVRVFQIDAAGNSELVRDIKVQSDGTFEFADLPAPPDRVVQPLWHYALVATATGRASGTRLYGWNWSGFRAPEPFTFQMPKAASIRGRVTNEAGEPIAEATVSAWSASGLMRPVADVLNDVTDADGRFEIADIWPWDPAEDESQPVGGGLMIKATKCLVSVRHPNYGSRFGDYERTPAEVNVVLQPAATVVGIVFDEVAGEPAAGVTVSMQATNASVDALIDSWRQTTTDERGRYTFAGMSEGKYNIWIDAKDRTCAAVESLQTTAGQQIAAPFIRLVEGGWIEGDVLDAAGNPVAKNAKGEPVQIGIYGPSRPRSGAGIESTTVDERGHFRLRAAPGTNYPYVCVDMAPLQTMDVGPVEVLEGKTTPILVRVAPQGAPMPALLAQPAVLPPVVLPEPIEAERDAAEAIRKHGGWYKLDDDRHVVEVNMVYFEDKDGRRDNPQSNVDSLEHVAAFPRLKTLLLQKGQATDAGLAHLRGMEQLERIYMWDASAVTDAGAAHLAGVPNLAYIHLSNSRITDEAIHSWQALPKLYGLSLQGNRFSDKALEFAGAMPNLRELFVGGINDRASTISDAGLAHLAELTNLERLDVQRSNVTDAGLVHLAELKRLHTLWLSGTQVTPEGLANLSSELPKLNAARAGVRGRANTTRRDAINVQMGDGKTPELAYLAWQAKDDDDAAGPAVGRIWDRDGNEVTGAKAAELAKLVPDPVHTRWLKDRDLSLRPLVLWFADGSQLEPRSVPVAVVADDGRRLGESTALTRHFGGYLVSAVAPLKPYAWGNRLQLEARRPFGPPTVVRDLEAIPEGPVQIGPGVEWEATWTDEHRLVATLRTRRRADDEPQPGYSVRIYAKGSQWPLEGRNGATRTFDDRQEVVQELRVARGEVDLVRFTRQSYVGTRYMLPLRLDFLQEAEEAATGR